LIEARTRTDVGQIFKLRGGDLKALRVPAVPIHEQQPLSKALNQAIEPLQRATALIDRHLELISERRQAVITAAVTGHLDVPGAA
jgi:type I restriction enzyme S subunit